MGSTFATVMVMGIFKPSHQYKASFWLTAIPYLEHELQMILTNSSPRGNDKERKLLVIKTLLVFLRKEDYLRKKEVEGDKFLSLRLTWKEIRLLDDLWWGIHSPLSEEELSQVLAGPGARERTRENLGL